MTLTFACVLLTTGDRPTELQQAIASVHGQRHPVEDVVVVLNSDRAYEPPPGVRLLTPGRNLGIPAGRNLGLHATDADLVLFLDDDATLSSSDFVAEAVARFRADPRLAVLSCRIADEEGATQRRHVPRLRVGDPQRSSRVTTFLGGAAIVRARAFREVGGLPEEFFYAHEETSLAWRLVAAGWTIRYDASLVIHHPRTTPGRHATARHLGARNRVLLARRHLPWPLAVLYVANWLALSLLRDPAGGWAYLRGTVAGLRLRSVPRQAIGWRAVLRLARLGRPPLL